MQKQALICAASFRINERKHQTFEITLSGIVMCFLYLTRIAVSDDCPLEVNPKRAVVRYNSSVSVDCSTNVTHDGIGWEASEERVPTTKDKSLITWSVWNLREWDINPMCYINYDNTQCLKYLPVTVYKTPDSVSISTVDHTGPVTEGSMLNLQCEIMNVAPVQYLTVRWYKGKNLLHHENFTDTIKTPMNISVTHKISPVRADDGAQYRCEAELQLGAEGPQPPPTVTSEPLNITVHFPPVINVTKLPSIVPVFRGDSLVLVCEAEGNPKPTISWSTTNKVNDGYLTITEATLEDGGSYDCTAENSVNTTSRTVQVVIQDISISTVGHAGPMIEGREYKLQCDIYNVVYPQSLIVRWYKRHEVYNGTNIMVNDTIKTPVNILVTHKISPVRADDGAQYRCEAELQLGAEGPSQLTSETLNITVHFPPVINETKLPSIVPVFRGYPLVLVCEAEGNPKPTISWSPNNMVKVTDGNLTITEATLEGDGIYSCTAENSVSTTTRKVNVVLKEDYLPLIAGFVAVAVAVISVIFIFIYSIYYKKAKMGHYSLKDAKPSAQNGNIAQNGKDNTIPMKKLSQSNILA